MTICFFFFGRFYPNHTHVIHALSNIMRSKFDSPYHTWKEIPIDVRNMWFDEFKVSCLIVAKKKKKKIGTYCFKYLPVLITLDYF